MNKNTISIIILIFTALGAGYYLSVTEYNNHPENIVLLSPAKELKNISLIDHNNNIFTKENLIGKWSLIFFGYTSCPDICPTTLHVLTDSYKKLLVLNYKVLPQIIFISVDPDRDRYKGNPNKLKNYISLFHQDFIAATGNHSQLKILTSQLGAAYGMKKSSGLKKYNKEEYEVAHTPLIFIVNPQGQFHGFIRPPHTPELIINSLKYLAKNG